MDTAIILKIQRYSIHDGPGIRTSVFLKGCPLNCWWCHNPESQDSQIVGEFGIRINASQILDAIEKDLLFYDESGGGVTFTGGEPLMQYEFLYNILRQCKLKGIHTAVDTCGFVPWNKLEAVSSLTDLFLYDVKIMDDDKHIKYTGVSNKLILENLHKLSRIHPQIKARIPIIPSINNDSDNISKTAEFLSELGIRNVNLLPYHTTGMYKYDKLGMEYKLDKVCAPNAEEIEWIAQYFINLGFNVKIGG